MSTTMAEIMRQQLQMYCDAQIEIDEGFKQNYREDLMGGLCKHVTAKARKALNSKDGMLPDEVVFKWVRDYFNDRLYEVEDKKVEEKKEKEQLNLF